jgi:hypothetical protein
MVYGGSGSGAQNISLNGSVTIASEGTGQIILKGTTDGGGTWSDTIVNVMCWEVADDATLRFQNNNGLTKQANITLDGTSDLLIENTTTGDDINIQTVGAGITTIKNATTNQNSILTVLGNGTGTPKAILKNASMEVDLTCEADGKLYVRDPTSGNRFILDASGAATGITFPDSTVQTTAATGGISGTIADDQIAVGSAADTIEGTSALSFTATVLTVENQIDLGATGAAGILKNTQNNQDLKINVMGTGEVKIENATTNQNSILSVEGNGTGTPKAILKNASMEVDLTCEADGKLYVRDPTSGNRFILDASGAATGITFPDSTVQTTAATGGGSIMERGYKTATYYNLNPIQMYTQTTQALSANKIRVMPFLVNADTTVDRLSAYAASTSGTADLSIGLYNMDSDGEPSTNILTEEFTNIATGYHTANISQALTAGWYFYFVWCNESVNYGITNTTAGSLGYGLVKNSSGPTNYGGSLRVFNQTYATGSAPSLAGVNPNQIEVYNVNGFFRMV